MGLGAEDQQSAPPDALRVGVEQVRGPVQSDGGLPGARGALDADRGGEVRADQVVLLGLDGGGDVPHGSDAGPFDLAGDDVARPGLACAEPLVLQPGEVGRVPAAAGRPAETAADGDTARVVGGGLVEGPGDGGAPVDDEGGAAGSSVTRNRPTCSPAGSPPVSVS